MCIFKYKQFCVVMAVFLLLTFMLSGCSDIGQDSSGIKINQTAKAAEFAEYPEYSSNVTPSLTSYQLAQDLSNVENSTRFNFSEEARTLLVKNGFVVDTSSWGEEFFMMYEPNRYDGIPNFITTDAMLHNYHLFFDNLLERTERDHLINELKLLNQLMLDQSQQQYESLEGSLWANSARRNLAFFTVGSLLMDPSSEIPAPVQQEVQQEMELINQHQEIAVSPVFSIGQEEINVLDDLKEDYTQYIPRGHYTKSQELQGYFKAMMWYGRMNFRLKDEDETRSAVLITLALNNENILNKWQTLYDSTNFFVGKSDDLGFYEYNDLLGKVYGEKITLSDLTEDENSWKQFMDNTSKLQPPMINSIPIFDESIQPDRDAEIKGFRFMGQRYTLDADIFQRLIYREVKENPEGIRRVLPRGLDIPAALGSEEAYEILIDLGDTSYENYPENMSRMQSYISQLDKDTWTQNLYWSWLYTLIPLTDEIGEGYPSFMQNQAWTRKQLNTFLGSWTELKHDTILYAKQVYAEMGGGMDGEVDDRGYVEPNPELYGRLASLAAMTGEGLKNRQLLDERDQTSLKRLEELALWLKNISEKELTGSSLSDEDYDLIRSFGGQLEHFWVEALRDKEDTSYPRMWNNPAALIADVATAPPDTVLEEGTGYVSQIYAVVPIEGNLRIVRGAVYSYYEFTWPISDRLTDEKWKAMLQNGEAPELPEWTRSFTAE